MINRWGRYGWYAIATLSVFVCSDGEPEVRQEQGITNVIQGGDAEDDVIERTHATQAAQIEQALA